MTANLNLSDQKSYTIVQVAAILFTKKEELLKIRKTINNEFFVQMKRERANTAQL